MVVSLLIIGFSAAVIAMAVYVIVKRYRKHTITVVADETALQVPNVCSTTTPSVAHTNFRERKVSNILTRMCYNVAWMHTDTHKNTRTRTHIHTHI